MQWSWKVFFYIYIGVEEGGGGGGVEGGRECDHRLLSDTFALQPTRLLTL
jgi:hypothetical protein